MATSGVRSPTETGKRAAQSRSELRNYELRDRSDLDDLATIYHGVHLTLDRPVSVYVLRRTDWVSVSRFQLAARLAARLNHPHLLPVIDAGHDDHYGDYIVTPQLNARPLSAVLADGALPPVQVFRIANQLAGALEYLHAQQIIHRDLQPANILLTADGVAYLTGLGMAAGPETPDLSSVDMTAFLTPYSAPEQQHDQAAAAPTLDVYSLGAVVYHMLSGAIPPAPAAAWPALPDAALAPAERVLRRMLAPDPSDRFGGPAAALAALRQALRDQIDQSTVDMEESRWEATAEWLENPLETVFGDVLDQQYYTESRKRADELHRANAVRHLLNRWSRRGFFRRASLGNLVEPEQIVSYNVYCYELHTAYETRTSPEPRVRPQAADEVSATLPVPSVWEVTVPDLADGISNGHELVLPNSLRVYTCTECQGAAKVICKTCNGSGTVERPQRTHGRNNSQGQEKVLGECPTCRGYSRMTCPACEGQANLVEEQVFTWSRADRLWENTDDMEALPEAEIRRRLRPVYNAPIDLFEGRWHSVAPLAELLRAAVDHAGEHTRLVAAELRINGTPVTEVDYRLNDRPHRLYFIGFDNALIGDWAMLNPERVALAALSVVLVLALLAVLLVFFL